MPVQLAVPGVILLLLGLLLVFHPPVLRTMPRKFAALHHALASASLDNMERPACRA